MSRVVSRGVSVALLGLGQVVVAQEPVATPPCQVQTLRGHVRHGEPFEAQLPGGLVFRLDPDTMPQNPPGWTIRVGMGTARDEDYSMVVTPPYRFWNPRYVDTAYGVTATEALARTPREFSFVASSADYQTAKEALDVLLWPYTYSEAEVKAADQELSSLPRYPGIFWIEDGAAAPPDAGREGGIIQWITFRVDVCVPR